jgi:hypothetical protein
MRKPPNSSCQGRKSSAMLKASSNKVRLMSTTQSPQHGAGRA